MHLPPPLPPGSIVDSYACDSIDLRKQEIALEIFFQKLYAISNGSLAAPLSLRAVTL